ncbi:Uncharacterized enzyme of heme biosynthesis [Chromobacterium violaceum]|uniref:Uncharacterized enzyme of heme biosynthesis n=1 Tax=Chromobacterium violaceum TaxID=536 RepID=A0A447T427_CHRVL|nr:Uncharacterized enzyme of heme biosynthesis [Chromobacterium violaceum]
MDNRPVRLGRAGGLASTLNTGYAILFLPPYRMEVSFNLMIVLVVALIVVTHIVLRLIALAADLPRQVQRFQRQKKLKAAATRCARPASPFSRALPEGRARGRQIAGR